MVMRGSDNEVCQDISARTIIHARPQSCWSPSASACGALEEPALASVIWTGSGRSTLRSGLLRWLGLGAGCFCRLRFRGGCLVGNSLQQKLVHGGKHDAIVVGQHVVASRLALDRGTDTAGSCVLFGGEPIGGIHAALAEWRTPLRQAAAVTLPVGVLVGDFAGVAGV